MSKNMAEKEGTNDVTVWRMRVKCWINKATCTYANAHALGHTHPCPSVHTHTHINNTHSFFTAKMIRERALMLRYTYIAPLVVFGLKINRAL